VEMIETEIKEAEEELEKAKVALEKVKSEFIEELKKAYSAYVTTEIKKFIESDTGSDLFARLSHEKVEKLKLDISNLTRKDVSEIFNKICRLDEWFECNVDRKSNSYVIGLNSEIWRTMKTIDKSLIKIFGKYGLKVLDATWGDYFFTPADWSSFSKKTLELHEKFVRTKEKYCNSIKNYDEQALEYRKYMAKKKWESIPIQ